LCFSRDVSVYQALEYGAQLINPEPLDGIPVSVGGLQEIVPVHLESTDGIIYNCPLPSAILAKHDSGTHLFTFF